LVEQSSQGAFTPKGHHDILTTTIGRTKHPRRVYVAGSGVSIRQYFGGYSCQSSCTHIVEYQERLTQQTTKKVRVNLYDKVTKKVTERVMCQF